MWALPGCNAFVRLQPILPSPFPCRPSRWGAAPCRFIRGPKALEDLFGAKNRVFKVRDEVALNAHFGATALCSPLLEQLMTTTHWLAEFTGDEGLAESYVREVIRGYLPEQAEPGSFAADLQSPFHRRRLERHFARRHEGRENLHCGRGWMAFAGGWALKERPNDQIHRPPHPGSPWPCRLVGDPAGPAPRR